MNSAEIETPVTDPMVINTREGGIVSVCAPVAESRRNEITGLCSALLHFRKQNGGHGSHIGSLGPRDAGDEVHGSHQDVV